MVLRLLFAALVLMASDGARAAGGCQAVAGLPALLQHVAEPVGSPPFGNVRLTFVGHATFLIESPGGIRIETDYNDFVRSGLVPDVATMNHAHSSHFTNNPDPRIRHVLRGWRDDGQPTRHDLQVGDVHIRSVATNIRDWAGGTILNGNSIFIFEVAGLCVGHLGHLHHTLEPAQLAAIGQLDVVLVPVDGGYTMDLAGMVEVIRALKARIVIPMHYFNQSTLKRFLDRIASDFTIERSGSPAVLVSPATLPADPKVLVLPGQ